MVLPLFAGIIATVVHVFSGPDHLAAVTPLVIEARKKSGSIGLAWGLGHLSGMVVIGLLFLAFQDFIPVEAISEHSERLVGIVLIGVGLWAFAKVFQQKRINGKTPKGIDKFRNPQHQRESPKWRLSKLSDRSFLASLGIGFIHGIAGVAHFLLLLPVLGFASRFEGIQYIIGFALGTVVAMFCYELVLGRVAGLSKQSPNPAFFVGVRFAGGIFAILIGVYWLYLGL